VQQYQQCLTMLKARRHDEFRQRAFIALIDRIVVDDGLTSDVAATLLLRIPLGIDVINRRLLRGCVHRLGEGHNGGGPIYGLVSVLLNQMGYDPDDPIMNEVIVKMVEVGIPVASLWLDQVRRNPNLRADLAARMRAVEP
jgi:hypothetical protein